MERGNKRDENELLCLVPDLKLKPLAFPTSVWHGMVVCYICPLLCWVHFSIPNLLRVFSPKGMLNFLMLFSASIEMIT